MHDEEQQMINVVVQGMLGSWLFSIVGLGAQDRMDLGAAQKV